MSLSIQKRPSVDYTKDFCRPIYALLKNVTLQKCIAEGPSCIFGCYYDFEEKEYYFQQAGEFIPPSALRNSIKDFINECRKLCLEYIDQIPRVPYGGLITRIQGIKINGPVMVKLPSMKNSGWFPLYVDGLIHPKIISSFLDELDELITIKTYLY